MTTYRHLAVSQETYDLITQECIEEFKRHHPHLKVMRVTQEMISRRIADHYLDRI